MRIVFFDAHSYEQDPFNAANKERNHQITYLSTRLTRDTVRLAQGAEAVCCFVNDTLDRTVLENLASQGIRLIALRCAGFNNLDLAAAVELRINVVRVPAYSPHAVAEHAVALLLCLNRKIHRASARVREGNFSLEGLVGFDLYGKTVGIVGTGRIGHCFAAIMRGFGCEVLAFDPTPDVDIANGVRYVDFDVLLTQADIISLHAPLTPQTHHMFNRGAFERMKRGAILLNTSRGGLVDTAALIKSLKSGHVGAVGLDVYEREAGIFFEDWSSAGLQDDLLARLLSFPNVLVTGHQAFLTDTALTNIAQTTFENIDAFQTGAPLVNAITPQSVLPPRV